ncbi:MAG: methyl-accepting chemotaxis protein [Thermodesulfobacteriota bacterium]
MFAVFKRLRLGYRIGCGFGLIILMAGFLGYVGWNGVNRMHAYMSEYALWVDISAVVTEEINLNALKIASAVDTYTSSPHDANRVAFLKTVQETEQGLQKWAAIVQGKPELEQILANLRQQLKGVQNRFADYDKALNSNQMGNLLTTETKLRESTKPLLLTLDKAVRELIRPAKEQEIRSAGLLQRRVQLFSLIATAAVLVAGILLSLLLVRAVTKPIHRAIEELSEGTEKVSEAASQVAAASMQVAEGSSQQAAFIEETSSSLEEMSTMTRQNADHAGQADRLMKEANSSVQAANQSMTGLTGSMQEISKASEQTFKIVKTIDEIAFQTNLLALNAAVEAARAGEAGAGFAVVAGEVRNLAMRAAEAAKNTAALIEETVRKIKDGSQLVARTSEAFGAVATGAGKVGGLIGEIAAASGEQAQGIEQVNKAVGQMDRVVQGMAASAEESASASQQMKAQAERMKQMVTELVTLVHGASRKVLSDRNRAKALEGTVLREKPVPQAAGLQHRPQAVPRAVVLQHRPGPKALLTGGDDPQR